METFHFDFEEGFHFGEFFGVSGVLGEVSEFGIFFTVFGEKLVGVLFEIEELGFADGAVEDVEFHELPVAFSDGAHPSLGASGVDSEEGVADGLLFASVVRTGLKLVPSLVAGALIPARSQRVARVSMR